MKYFLWIFVFTSFFSSGVFAADGKFVYILGDVSLLRDGQAIKVSKKNRFVRYGDTVVTGKKSLAIYKVGGHSVYKQSAESNIEVLRPSEEEDSDALIKAGSAFVKFNNPDGNKRMKVRTRAATFGVRGTEFFVSYGKTLEDTWMCVREGKVQVDAKGEKGVLVKAGEGVRVGDKISDPKFLPWTSKLNWSFDTRKDLVNHVSIEEAYEDPLNFDYD